MLRFNLAPLLAAGIVLIGTRTAQAEEASRSVVTYEAYLQAVAAHHPERELDEKSLARAKAEERRAGLLADPQLSVGRDEVPLPGRYQRVMVDEADRKGAQTTYGLAQSFPWPGTLAADERAARARTATVEADLRIAALQRHFEAAELFLRLVRTAKLLEAERADLVVVGGLRDFAHEKFRQGLGSHMEFLQTHSEAGVLKANVGALELDLGNLKRHALLLMGDPAPATPDSVDFVLDWPALATESPPSTRGDAVADVTRERIQHSKDAELSRDDANYRRTLPSFMASGMLMQEDGGMRMYQAMLGVTLPIYSSLERRSISDAKAIVASRGEAELSWHDRRKAVALAQAEGRIAQVEANLKALAQEIIPPLREHIEVATTRFSQGKADIGGIIDGRRMLLNLQMTEIRTRETLALARLGVEKITAGLVDDEMDLEVPQLAGTGSSGMSRMGPDSGGVSDSERMSEMKRMPKKGPLPGRKAPGSMPIPEDDATRGGGNQGMGM
jgi:outer membrane protein TolC